VDGVLVVVGHRGADLEAHLAGEGVTVIENPDYAQGMLSSIQCGVRAAPPQAEWLLIALGDQPAIRPETVDLLLTAAGEALASGSTILVPSHAGRRGHPLLIHRTHREAIASLNPALGLRELLRTHPGAVRHVEIDDPGVLSDMDTRADYERELARAAAETP
jgi:molybdenum cofactor cytidylyltransferase